MRESTLIGHKVAGRFTIKRFLGEGGMATVFVAEQSGEPREVALKIMNEDLNADHTFVRRFQREAKAAARVQHPNSVSLIDYGVAEGLSYIAMELLDGDDLYVLLERDGAITQGRAARILVEVCDALMVAHELGIVHRDLKPENIMVLADKTHPNGERVKVLDFGIAKLLTPEMGPSEPRFDPGSSVTRAGTFIGTPAYMSPEQCALQIVDTRADIYTCGVLLFQLVTGRLPFEGQTPLHTAMLHLHEPPPQPSSFAPNIDPRLEAVILKALAKKPTERHQTARHLASTLRRLLVDLPDVRVATVGKPAPGSLRQAGRATRNSVPADSARVGAADGAAMAAAAPETRTPAPTTPRVDVSASPARPTARPAEPSDPYDSMRTLVRSPPSESDEPPRFARLITEVVAPGTALPSRPPPPAPPPPANAVSAAPAPGLHAASEAPPPVAHSPSAPPRPFIPAPAPVPAMPQPRPVSRSDAPAAPLRTGSVPPPRAVKPTLKSAASFESSPPQRPASIPPPAFSRSTPDVFVSAVIPIGDSASGPPAPLATTQISASSEASDPSRPVSYGAPIAPLEIREVASAPQPDTAKDPPPKEAANDRRAVPEPIPALPPPPIGRPVMNTPAEFAETTRMESPLASAAPLPPPNPAAPKPFVGTVQTVPMIPPAIVAAALAAGPRLPDPPPPPAPLPPPAAPPPQRSLPTGTAPMAAPAAGAPAPYPGAASIARRRADSSSPISGTRALVLGFVVGALLMSVVAAAYFVIVR